VPLLGEMTAESLREFAEDKLARYQIPRYVLIVEEFPMTVTGKIRKVGIRQKWGHPRPGGRRNQERLMLDGLMHCSQTRWRA
jgi:acyl-CoA synthetase (AMP-forming)/AMP-acid ligase II